MNRYEKYTIILILGLILILSNSKNINSLEMLEPITSDLDNINSVDLGSVAPGESFLVSFLLKGEEDYNSIICKNSVDDIIIEHTKKTPESIFTTIHLSKNLKGPYILELLLNGREESKEINLNMFVTDNVISSLLLPYEEKTKFFFIGQQ